jgi:excisionase family DNA binding protein
MEQHSKLMDVQETAQYVGLSTFTVRRLAKQGALPAAKIGRAYRFKKDDIDSYMRTQYKGVTEDGGA